jgi:hypothetical protein
VLQANKLDAMLTDHTTLLWMGLLRCFACSCTGVSVIVFCKLVLSGRHTLACKAGCRCRIRVQWNRCSRHDRASELFGNSELLSCGFPVCPTD